jgi:hypothetical protein
MYLGRAGFLDGVLGLILSCLYEYYTFLNYARLWEVTVLGARGALKKQDIGRVNK